MSLHSIKKYLSDRIRNKNNFCRFITESIIIKFLFFVLIFISLINCGDNEPKQKNYTAENGSIEFSLEWVIKPDKNDISSIEGPAISYTTQENQTKEITCAEYNISNISAYLYDSSGIQIKTGNWPCLAQQGTLISVQAGSNYRLNIFGISSSGTAIYSGEKTGISVSNGATTQLGKIEMSPTPSNQLWQIDSFPSSGEIIATHTITPNSKKYLIVDTDGAKAVIGSSTYGWRFVKNGNYYQIIQSSDKCLEVEGGSQNERANVQVSSCGQGDHQLWDFSNRGSNYYQVRAKHSAKCLDVESSSTADRAKIQQFSCR